MTRNMVLSEIPLVPDVKYIGEVWGQSVVNPFVKEPLLKSMQVKNNLGQIVMQYTFVYDYYEDSNLPKITSLNKDVFGFKSNIVKSSIKDSYGFPIRPIH